MQNCVKQIEQKQGKRKAKDGNGERKHEYTRTLRQTKARTRFRERLLCGVKTRERNKRERMKHYKIKRKTNGLILFVALF